ncbi:MAG: hypothetical protein SV375_09860, partial [Thermodesulfobacteriota bacterium]|nr:hypothetical protein [Thermodesulfobacteriota bacterium]
KYIGKEPIILKKDISWFIGNNIQNAVTEKCMGLITSGVPTFFIGCDIFTGVQPYEVLKHAMEDALPAL